MHTHPRIVQPNPNALKRLALMPAKRSSASERETTCHVECGTTTARPQSRGGASLKRVCVFCGSSPGARPEYVQAARELGSTLAGRDIGLVFGGGSVGLMGQVAKAALGAGGEVIGVITKQLVDLEVALTELPDLRVVASMHERKALMAELADGFIVFLSIEKGTTC